MVTKFEIFVMLLCFLGSLLCGWMLAVACWGILFLPFSDIRLIDALGLLGGFVFLAAPGWAYGTLQKLVKSR